MSDLKGFAIGSVATMLAVLLGLALALMTKGLDAVLTENEMAMKVIKIPAGDPIEAFLKKAFDEKQTVCLILPDGSEMLAVPKSAMTEPNIKGEDSDEQ